MGGWGVGVVGGMRGSLGMDWGDLVCSRSFYGGILGVLGTRRGMKGMIGLLVGVVLVLLRM